ncbi:MAG: hypothetical protein HY431_00675 [Candidatus Levybacteria bacterium]|nr:hypothetical protein [Candidatus Levybacteria bacterium]
MKNKKARKTKSEELRLPDFLQVPSIVLKDKELTPLDGFVYGVIYWFAKLTMQKCILSNASIAKLLNAKAGSVANSISKLARKEMINVKLDEKNHREEIIPLIVYSKKKKSDEGGVEGGSLKNEGGVGSSTNEGGVNLQMNRIIRNNKNTVNGDIKILQNMPNLNIPDEQNQYIAGYILKEMGDKHSAKFYRLVASKIPEDAIRRMISEIRTDGARNPRKVFTYKVKQFEVDWKKKHLLSRMSV